MDVALKTPVAEGDRRDWSPGGGRGAKGDILRQAEMTDSIISRDETYFLVQSGKSLRVSTA